MNVDKVVEGGVAGGRGLCKESCEFVVAASLRVGDCLWCVTHDQWRITITCLRRGSCGLARARQFYL